MAGMYQALVEASVTAAVAMARTRVPVGAAIAEAQAGVNMGVTQPHRSRDSSTQLADHPGRARSGGPFRRSPIESSVVRPRDDRFASVAPPDGSVRRPNAGDVLLPTPSVGRVFQAGRRVRGGDVDPCGHLRLDALACYLQDVSSDDTDDARLPDAMGWVVRRTVIEQRHPAQLGEGLELATFCSGYGSRWAERRVSILGDRGALVDAATVWVHVDAAGRPKALPAEFHALVRRGRWRSSGQRPTDP